MEGIVYVASPSKTTNFAHTYGNLFHVLADAQKHGSGEDMLESVQQESPRVLSVLSSLLERMVAKNDVYVAHYGYALSPLHRLTLFHGLRAPSISVPKYVERIFKYANCSPSCFVVAYVYLDRFIHQQPGMPLTSLNVHRLLITSVMVAAKFLDDAYYNNAYYAKVGGVSTHEMNRLELEFLFRLGFRLQVTVQVFESYCSYLEREVAGFQASDIKVERTPSLNMPLQGKHCITGAVHQREVHEAEPQSNVYVPINIMEPVS
ncbi:hypothetical protein GOP47_0006375 [Adiantum capillus-veneris]|uniref:Cyclin n=1 Tax=Adiantum capillus-veneris TaxID=13818 RepID=A0A9D4V2R8_ADICA|nr:hypothetical protein GOP47_0006375 [Adiantum capillus-veneris]